MKICDLEELRQMDLKLICSTLCLQRGGLDFEELH